MDPLAIFGVSAGFTVATLVSQLTLLALDDDRRA
jgi:hypothetical protein